MKEVLESTEGASSPCVASIDGDTTDKMQVVLELPPLRPRDPGGEGSEVAMVSSGRDLLQELANTEPANVVSVEPDYYNQWARAPRQLDALPLPPLAPPLAARPIIKDGPCPRDKTRVAATPVRGVNRGGLKPVESAGTSQNGDHTSSKACQTRNSKETSDLLVSPSPSLQRGDLDMQKSATSTRCSRVSDEKGAYVPLNPLKTRKSASNDVEVAEKTLTAVDPPRTPTYSSRTPMQPSAPSFPMMDALEYISERLSLRSAGERGRASGQTVQPLDQQRRAVSRSQHSRRDGPARPPSLANPTSATPKPPTTAPGGYRLLPTTAASIPSGHPVISHSSSSGSAGSATFFTWTSSRLLAASPNPVISSGHPTSANSVHNSSRSSSHSDPPFAPGILPECPQTSSGRGGHFVSLKPCTGPGGYPVTPKTPSSQDSSSAPVVPSTLGVVDFLELRREHMPVRAHSSSHRHHNIHRLHQYQQYFRSHRPRTHNIQLSRAALLHQRPRTEGKGMHGHGRRSTDEPGSGRRPVINIPTGRSKPGRGSDECLISVKIKVRNSSKTKRETSL